MKRIEALAVIEEVFEGLPLVVTCGASARELASLVRRDSHLPLLDSMGLAGPVGLGVALATDRPVGVVEGDGAVLMGFQMLATIRSAGPGNLTLVILDNHQHASADLMPSQAESVSLAGACRGLGLTTVEVDEPDGLRQALVTARDNRELTVLVVTIEGGNTAGVDWLLDDPAVLGARFRAFLAAPTS